MTFGLISRLAWGGCVLASLVSCEKPAARNPSTAPITAAPMPVTVARAQLRPMERTITISGSLAAQEASVLSAKVPGRLLRLSVDVGSRVEAGDVIAELDPRDYELRMKLAAGALAEARAALGLDLHGREDTVDLGAINKVRQADAMLNEAQKTLERIRSLSASQIASKSELDAAEAKHAVELANYEVAREEARSRIAVLAQRRAEFEIAQKQLSDSQVRAPFAGVIQSRPAAPGEYVATGAPIATLVQSNPLRLRLEVPERDSFLVAKGQKARLKAEGWPREHEGRIVRLSPALDERSRTLLIEAEVPNDGTLRPGLFVRATIVLTDQDSGLAVPRRALVIFAGIKKVLTVKDGKAVEHNVTTGRQGEDWVEILTGLEPGASVILDSEGLHGGQPVSIAAPEPARPQPMPAASSG